MLTPILAASACGYLLGSLPFGYIVARARGVNIFEVGSRNPGATNVRRVLGWGPGNLVLALDMLKGALASSWALLRFSTGDATGPFGGPAGWLGPEAGPDDWVTIGIAGLVGAMAGHSFSCFTTLRGGKGVATGAGGFAVIFPHGALVALAVWLATAAVSRYVSLASMLAAVSLPVAALVQGRGPVLLGACSAVALFVIQRHRSNISRFLAGTENKLGRPPAAPKS
ncbi:MAG: glycerol-3-phosphate 1-O-acyltransferase PlsY [Opitutus sp.]